MVLEILNISGGEIHYMSKNMQTSLLMSTFSYFKMQSLLIQAFSCAYTALLKESGLLGQLHISLRLLCLVLGTGIQSAPALSSGTEFSGRKELYLPLLG